MNLKANSVSKRTVAPSNIEGGVTPSRVPSNAAYQPMDSERSAHKITQHGTPTLERRLEANMDMAPR